MALLKSQRFLPLFLTQFLGAFNDNLLKNALVMLVTYRLAVETGENAQVLVTLAAGLFILPFFLFSALAGQLADKFDRARITRIIKFAEIIIMIFATIGFITGSVWFLMLVLFAMGTHSTFFGPIKYALLPQHLAENELLSGNAYIEAGTFLAILLGTILGGLLILQDGGILLVSSALMIFAIIGYGISRFIPVAPGPDPDLKLNKNLFQETWRIVGFAKKDRRVFRCILGVSWFWLVGATFLSQFPPYVKDVLQADAEVVTLLLTVFSIGIGVGSFICNKLLKGTVQSTYVPLAALGMTLFGFDLYASSLNIEAVPALLSFSEFLAQSTSWRILADFFFIAICSGIYIVPLYAIMQHESEASHRARIIAANNVMNALFMVASSIAILGMLALHFTIPQVFLCVAIANGLVALYICSLLPDALLRSVARAILSLLYRVEIRGMEHYKAAGERVLLVANHTSFLDAALIAAYLPEKITFAVNTHIARKWWMRPMLALVDAFPLDPTNPLATKSLIDRLKQNHKCMIFPEGRITVTGSLMKIYEGPGMIADKSGAVLLPIRIEGAQYSPFSRLKGKVRLRLFPKVTLTILSPHTFSVADHIKGRERRQASGAELYDMMSEMMFASSDWRQPLFTSLINAQAIHGRKHSIAEDIERKPLNYGQFIARAFTLGRLFNQYCKNERTVGLLLPNSVASCAAFFALQAFAKVVALLNFTAGSSALVIAAKAAQLKRVITSRRFIEMAKLQDTLAALESEGIHILYLEDLRKQVSLSDKLYGALASRIPSLFMAKPSADAPAVICLLRVQKVHPKVWY